MEQITLSILTLLALYVLYSECIKIPSLIKKNKTIFYLLIIGFYLYYSNNVEGMSINDVPFWVPLVLFLCMMIVIAWGAGEAWTRAKPCWKLGCRPP